MAVSNEEYSASLDEYRLNAINPAMQKVVQKISHRNSQINLIKGK